MRTELYMCIPNTKSIGAIELVRRLVEVVRSLNACDDHYIFHLIPNGVHDLTESRWDRDPGSDLRQDNSKYTNRHFILSLLRHII